MIKKIAVGTIEDFWNAIPEDVRSQCNREEFNHIADDVFSLNVINTNGPSIDNEYIYTYQFARYSIVYISIATMLDVDNIVINHSNLPIVAITL